MTDLLNQYPWLSIIFSFSNFLQIGALAVAYIAGRILQNILQPQLEKLDARVSQWPIVQLFTWTQDILPLIQENLKPFTLWVAGVITLSIFNNFAWQSTIIQWLVPFLLIWFIYNLLGSLIYKRMPAEQARVWHLQIIRPIIYLVAILHGIGLLDDFLNAEIRPSQELLITLRSILIGIFVFIIFRQTSNFSRQFLRDKFLPQAGVEPALGQVISAITSYIILVAGILMAFNTIGFDLTTLTVIVGGVSVGIGFGLQDLMNNFVSGFILLFERTISPGDVIKIDDTISEVQDVGLRTMRLRTIDNIEKIVPNASFLSNTVTSYTHQANSKVRIHISAGTSYSSDPHQVMELLRQAATHPLVLKEPHPQVHFTEFGDSSINFELLVWVNRPLKIPEVASDIRLKIWDLFAANNIEIPFPQRDIYIRTVNTIPISTSAPNDMIK